MFGALLAVLVVALALRVWSAARGYDFRHGSDADLYQRLAAHLHEDGTFELPGSQNPYDFAPGVPYFAAAVYALAGQVTPLTARVVLAVLSTLVVVVVFLIGRRLAGPWAGLVGAALTAVYPPAIFYAGLLMGEPLAMLTVGLGDPRVPVGGRRGPLAVGVGAARRAVRPDRVRAAGVRVPHRPVRAARARWWSRAGAASGAASRPARCSRSRSPSSWRRGRSTSRTRPGT